ncbi:EthD family reductase [Amnibacterium kyonggiense]|uniref:EthD domain-containing protein n=1 Tax=Amnibacterium kyonggiense TaxID=595671 RepID=A0A4R7FM26_9MICO|nr:EthD family reductase [Amnibacterium kyonggiense]TDS77453.1 hypothetical protein CLV52_2399 [Amnibacterium kyonggiense]
MPTKIELIVDNQDDNDALDAQWPGLLQLARALPGLERLESGKVWPKEDGSPTPAHRSLLLYFPGYDAASAAVAGPEGGAFFQAFFPAVHGKVTALFTDIEEG